MTSTFQKKTLRIVTKIIVILVCVVLVGFILFVGCFPWVYKQYDHDPLSANYSPDGRFRIEYYAIPFLPFKPYDYFWGFGCSDCPGYVRLVENNTGKVLQEKYFDMGQSLSSGPKWEEKEVSIKLFATWTLPDR